MKIIELRQNCLEGLLRNRARRHSINADLHDLEPGVFQFRDEFTREEETIGGQARGKPEFAAVANEFDNIRMPERLAADESDAHGAKLANFPYPFFQIVEARVRPAVVVFGAIGTVEIATVRDVKTALQRFPIEETLTRFQNVIAGKFAADFIQVVLPEFKPTEQRQAKKVTAPQLTESTRPPKFARATQRADRSNRQTP